MEIFLAAARDLSYIPYLVVNHPFYSSVGCFLLIVGLLRFYCRLTVGICDSDEDMAGKTVLITGGSAGIGKATAEDMARRNARVILACRNLKKARHVADEIISKTGNKDVIVVHLDLSSFETVRKCAENVLKTEKKLHVLINNAGVYDEVKSLSEDGNEYILQSNHFGHFLLTILLLDLLKKSAPSRIINVASGAYKMAKLDVNDLAGKNCKFQIDRYGRSKLANILFTKELASRLLNTGVTVNALHPGMVKTEITSKTFGFFPLITKMLMKVVAKSCDEGAQTSIYLAVHPNLAKTTGKYFSDCREEKVVGQASDKQLAKQFFEMSEKIVGISLGKA